MEIWMGRAAMMRSYNKILVGSNDGQRTWVRHPPLPAVRKPDDVSLQRVRVFRREVCVVPGLVEESFGAVDVILCGEDASEFCLVPGVGVFLLRRFPECEDLSGLQNEISTWPAADGIEEFGDLFVAEA